MSKPNTFSFFLSTNKQFIADKIWQTPFGGAEISAINLAKELSKNPGNDVRIFAGILEESYLDDSGIELYRRDKAHTLNHGVFVNVRLSQIVNPRFHNIKADKFVLWTGDAYDQPNNEIIWDPAVRDNLDLIICKSNWQRSTMLDAFSYLDESKVKVMYNGIVPEYFENLPTRQENRFIYCSTVFRGLEHIVRYWTTIKHFIPKAELHVFASLRLYSEHNNDMNYAPIYNALQKLDGVHLHDPVTQPELIREMAKSYAMLYPNHFPESSCGVALESMAAGCPVITTNLAGLAETVNMIGGGILIDSMPGDLQYDKNFIDEVVALCQNSQKRVELSQVGMKKAREYTWQMVAEQFLSLVS